MLYFLKKIPLFLFFKFLCPDELRICFCLISISLGWNYSLSSINTTWDLSREHWWGLIIFKFIEVLEGLIEYLSKIPSPHFQMESWAIAFSIFSLINFGIEYIWPIYQSLDKEIWFTISFFFIPRELHSVHFFSWATHLYMSLFPSVQPSVCQSVSRAPYLKSHTSSNYHFWYTCVKWWYLLGSYGGGGGKRAKNSSKWKITITSVTHYISRTV